MNISIRQWMVPVAALVVLAAGTITASAQTTGYPPPPAQGGFGDYLIQPGDDLAGIARRFGVSVDCLVQVNRISDPNTIYAGGSLDIATCQQQGGAQPVQPAAPAATYTVQRGDTLAAIARRFGLDVNCVARANSIINPDAIYPGLVLNLRPCGVQDGVGVIPSTYTIQAGDRLWDIARRFGVEVSCLVRVNAILDETRIRPGLVLQIDPCIQQAGGTAPLPTNLTYIVQRGDQMHRIAATFGVDADCLARINQIATPDFLITGEPLVIDYARCGTGEIAPFR